MGIALVKVIARISKVSVGCNLLVRKWLVRFEYAFGHSGRSKDPDAPMALEQKRFPRASKVPDARTSNICQDSLGPHYAEQGFLLHFPVPNLVELELPPSGLQGVLESRGRGPP